MVREQATTIIRITYLDEMKIYVIPCRVSRADVGKAICGTIGKWQDTEEVEWDDLDEVMKTRFNAEQITAENEHDFKFDVW